MGTPKRSTEEGQWSLINAPAERETCVEFADAAEQISKCVSPVKDCDLAKTCRRIRCLANIENVGSEGWAPPSTGSVFVRSGTLFDDIVLPQSRRSLQLHTWEWLAVKQQKLTITGFKTTPKCTPRRLQVDVQPTLVAHVKWEAASGKHPARKKTHVSIPLLATNRRHVAAEHAIGESKSGDPTDIDLPQTSRGGQNAVVGNADIASDLDHCEWRHSHGAGRMPYPPSVGKMPINTQTLAF